MTTSPVEGNSGGGNSSDGVYGSERWLDLVLWAWLALAAFAYLQQFREIMPAALRILFR